ncbi:MAG TPA: helix-turn-helix domain-containing protein [archaeon]|nr:helix-turn-helix domain-containing protein [archaeon]
MFENKRILSVNAAAKYSGYSCAVVQHWIDSGLLEFEEVPVKGSKNRCRRIRKADLDQFLERYLKKNQAPRNSFQRKETLILLER